MLNSVAKEVAEQFDEAAAVGEKAGVVAGFQRRVAGVGGRPGLVRGGHETHRFGVVDGLFLSGQRQDIVDDDRHSVERVLGSVEVVGVDFIGDQVQTALGDGQRVAQVVADESRAQSGSPPGRSGASQSAELAASSLARASISRVVER